jgi:hypothetical protein
MVTELRTHSNGSVYFFPRAYPLQAAQYMASVVLDGELATMPIVAGSGRAWQMVHTAQQQTETAVPLDILFLLDATGSMDDELSQLKDNIVAVSMQIKALPSQPDIRFALLSYRDQEEAYVTNLADFTPDIETFITTLAGVEAVGGGDYPEDLNMALTLAIHEASWRAEGSISLIFLIADAPPHLDYARIKIYSIASSGLDEQGVYIFRQLAQVTGGRFLFLTQETEANTPANSNRGFTVSDYTVSALDQLIVNLVAEELLPLAP